MIATVILISFPFGAAPRRKQKLYANKIKPIRKNGHLLLVTLLLANMIVNETLPVISDPVLGGGVQSVVVSTVLIVMYVRPHPRFLRCPTSAHTFLCVSPSFTLLYLIGLLSGRRRSSSTASGPKEGWAVAGLMTRLRRA